MAFVPWSDCSTSHQPPTGAHGVRSRRLAVRDPCQIRRRPWITGGPTVADFVNAVANVSPLSIRRRPLTSRWLGTPGCTSIFRLRRTSRTATSSQERRSLRSTAHGNPAIYAQGPARRHMWVLDVDGVRVVVQRFDYAGTSDGASRRAPGDRELDQDRDLESFGPGCPASPELRGSRPLRLARGDDPRADPRVPGRPAHRDRRRGARAFLPVVVVDDGSTDDTAAQAEAAGATVLRQHPERGQGRRAAARLPLRPGARRRGRRHARRRRPARPGRDPALPRRLRGRLGPSSSSAGATSARCRRSGGCRTRSAAGSSRLPSGGTSRTTSRAIGSSAGS